VTADPADGIGNDASEAVGLLAPSCRLFPGDQKQQQIVQR
jgi:hypothetical protein